MTTYERKPQRPTAQSGSPAQPTGPLIQPRVPAGGPLTRLVREAQRQQPPRQAPAAAGQGTNWTEVAQALTTKYHELQGKVTTVDLLGAIRELPDSGIQDLVINGVGGTHAEQLKLALRAPAPEGKAAAPAPLPQISALNAKATSEANPATAPAAAAKTPAVEQASGKGKISLTRAKAPAKAPAKHKPTPKKPGARATPQKARQKSALPLKNLKGNVAKAGQLQPAAQGNTPQSASGQKKGQATGGAQAGNLVVASRDEFRGLNVKLNPSMERGGKLVFSPSAWRAAEKGVQQALKERETLSARKLQGTGEAPEQATLRQSTQAQKPVKVPSATIKASEIKKHEQQNRQKNQARLKSVVAKANKARADIAKVQPKATAQITAAQKSAEATISAALQKTLGQIRTAEASARSTVTTRASAATAKVNSAHQATVQGIRQDTTQKIAALKQAAQAQKTQLAAQKAKLDSGVSSEFNATSAAIQGIGQSSAGNARSTGQSFAARYRAEPLPEQNALQKLANGDNYYADKRAAKVQAALDVANSYASEMTKAGSEQASQIMGSLPDALASNQTILTEYQKQLETYLTGQVTALQTQQQNAIAQANQQHSSLLAQIEAQRSQALSSIAQAAAQGRSQATSQASSKKQAVRTQGQQAVKGVASSVKQAQTQMQGRIQGFQKDVQGQLTLDAPEFAKAVGGFESYAQKGGTQAQAQVTKSASASAARVKAAAAPAAQALNGLGQSTASSLKAQATQSGAALSALASGGATGLKQALTSHQQATKAALDSANTQLKSFTEGFGKDGDKVLGDVKTQLGGTKTPFQSALNDALGKEPGDIEAAAGKAADSVQPRWKSVLKVVIDVVIVVATIAATIALAAVLGPVGLVLAGMAIGALGAVVGQGLKDAVDGQFSGWGAYGAAALGGAIGGAFGGAGGAVGNILAKGAMKGVTSGLAKGAMRVGVEATVGTGFDLAGQVATGYTNQAVFNQPYKLSDTFNAKNIAMTGVMNTAGTALASPSVVKFVGSKLSNINIPGKGLLGKFQNTLSGSRPIQAINKLDAKMTGSKVFTKTSAGLEKAGEVFGKGVGRGANALRPNTLRPNVPGRTPLPKGTPEVGKTAPETATPPARRALEDVSERFTTTETTRRGGSRQVTTEGELGVPGEVVQHRNTSEQRKVSRGTGDDAGHRIANMFGALGDRANLALQNWKMNRFGTWRKLEDLWAGLLKGGSRVNARVSDIFRPGENRPFYRKPEYTVTRPDGSTEIIDNVLYGNFHTPESRAKQGIPDRVDTPQENNVIDSFQARRQAQLDAEVQATATGRTPFKDWPGKVKSSLEDFTAWSQGKLNDAGTYLQGRKNALGDWLKANGKTNLKAAIKEMALGSLKKPGINQISNYLFDGKFGPITDAAKEALEGGVKGAAKGATKDPKLPADAPAPSRKQQSWKVTKDTLVGAGSGVVARFINNLTFTGRIGHAAEYLIAAIEGGLGGAGGRLGDISSSALLKAVMKENTNRYVKVLGKFASDSGLKSVFDFGMKNLANVANGNLFGSAYTWKNLLSGKEIVKVLANSGKFANLGKDLLPLVKTDLKRAGNALSEWKTQQWANLKDHLDTLGSKAKGKINDIKDYATGQYDAARTRLADFTGSQKAPVRMQENPDLLPGEARIIGHGEGNTTVEFGANTSDAVKNAHATTARDLRSANGLPRKISDKLQELRGRTPSRGGKEKLRLEAEAGKHQELASAYREAANTFPEGSVQRQHYEEQAALAEHYAREYSTHAAKTDPTLPDTKGFVETRLQSGRKEAMRRGYPEAPEGYQGAFYETGDLKLVKLNVNSPTMDYVPGKNGQPGEFRIISESTIPAQKGQSKTQKWDTERLVTDENGQVVALKQKMDDWLQRRADAQKEVDRIKRLGENLTPEQIAELKAYEQQVREQSRMIGEEAGKNYMASRFPDGAAEMIYPKDGVSNSRSGDFDQVWQVKDEQGNLQIIVIEAKGGTSSLGRRRSDKGPGSQYVEQGSKEYFDTIVSEMIRNKNDNNMRSTAQKLQDAADTGNVEYLEIRAPIESKTIRLPDGSSEITNTALDIKITPFILR